MHLGRQAMFIPDGPDALLIRRRCTPLSSPSYGSRFERKRLRVWLASTVKVLVVSVTGFPSTFRSVNLIVWEPPLTFTRIRSVSNRRPSYHSSLCSRIPET